MTRHGHRDSVKWPTECHWGTGMELVNNQDNLKQSITRRLSIAHLIIDILPYKVIDGYWRLTWRDDSHLTDTIDSLNRFHLARQFYSHGQTKPISQLPGNISVIFFQKIVQLDEIRRKTHIRSFSHEPFGSAKFWLKINDILGWRRHPDATIARWPFCLLTAHAASITWNRQERLMNFPMTSTGHESSTANAAFFASSNVFLDLTITVLDPSPVPKRGILV